MDKLVKVQLLAGASALLLVHIEVQGRLSTPTDFQVFGWRIFQYRMLIQVRELRKTKALLPPTIFSLGVLIDQPPNPGRAPRTQGSYQDKFLSQRTEFTFPIVELSQWHGRMDTLDALAPTNPFAVIVMAQILASMHADKATRLGPLLNIVRRLYDYGYSKDQINPLLRLVEWIIHLSQDLESEYFVAVDQLHQEHNMSYVTVVERVYTQRGLEQGREEGIEQGQALLLLGLIERRFGPVSDETVQRIQQANRQQLTAWSLNILDAKALDGVFLD
ncbi:DUF4351 domain-containing protein [Castellaniella sp.]|uniref:DUF4351 domain-containing protein n=1 Tax=Castellaniella sp. TaxID=1955812 RepID=UPI002AFDCDE0|nr:DUF4351 domain-containing protein [Castellaniella sp.]